MTNLWCSLVSDVRTPVRTSCIQFFNKCFVWTAFRAAGEIKALGKEGSLLFLLTDFFSTATLSAGPMLHPRWPQTARV